MLLVQFVHRNNRISDTYLIPKAFFENEERCPGTKRAFISLCDEDSYFFNKVNGLIISAFLNLTTSFPTPEDLKDPCYPGLFFPLWREAAKQDYKTEFGRDFDAELYSWSIFKLKTKGKVSLQGKNTNFENWYSKYFENDDDDKNDDIEIRQWKLNLLSSSSYINEFVSIQKP